MRYVPTIRRNEFWGAVLALVGSLALTVELIAIAALVTP